MYWLEAEALIRSPHRWAVDGINYGVKKANDLGREL
jgi:hypothetical protein